MTAPDDPGDAEDTAERDLDADALRYLDQKTKELRKKWIASRPWPFKYKRRVQDRAKELDYDLEKEKYEHEEMELAETQKRERTEAKKRETEEPWRRNLIANDKGVLSVPANVATILKYHRDWLGVIAYDAFAETIISVKPAPWHVIDAPFERRIGEWSDDDISRAINWLMRVEGLKVGPEIVQQAVSVVARTNTVHPVRDWLGSLTWDGVERLSTILPVYFQAEDTPYTRAVGARWLISAVARIYQPGCQVDCTLILESSKQGTGKTSGFRGLVPVPTWYADTGVTLGDKDSYQNLRGVWIYGLDELDSLKRAEVTKWKTYLSQTQDRYRSSYARRAETIQRQNVFCGTTNEDEYLADRTGNRRFWPVRLTGDVDVSAIIHDRDQIWAEAVARYGRGDPWHVDTPALRALCEGEQADRVHSDPWTTPIAKWLADPKIWVEGKDDEPGRFETFDLSNGVLSIEIATLALSMSKAQIATVHHMRIAGVLRELGYEKGPQHRENGARVNRYVKNTLRSDINEMLTLIGDNALTSAVRDYLAKNPDGEGVTYQRLIHRLEERERASVLSAPRSEVLTVGADGVNQ